MLKIFILVLFIVSVVFISYQQTTKNKSYRGVEVADTEIANNSEPELVELNKSVMNLSGKGFIETPKYVFEKTDIETLDLSHNKLAGSLQAEIRFLQNLKVLDLSNNQFTGVPAEIGQLKYLEVLDLSNNRITGLPIELGNLSNLKVLNLKGNEYSKYDLGLIKEKLPTTTVIEIE